MTEAEARSWTWPAADMEAVDLQVASTVHLPDLSAFASAVVPELSRLFGLHVSARAQPGSLPEGDGLLLLARLPLAEAAAADKTQSGRTADRVMIDVLVTETGVSALVDLLFGGAPTSQMSTALTRLPPSNASWLAVAQFLGRACAVAFESSGLPCRLPVDVPPRAAPDRGSAAHLLLELDFEGAGVELAFRLPEMAQPVMQSDTAPSDWMEQLRARTMEVGIRVSLRIAEQRLPVREVARLQPGDVLPLEQPEMIDVLVGGARFARLSVDGLGKPDAKEDLR